MQDNACNTVCAWLLRGKGFVFSLSRNTLLSLYTNLLLPFPPFCSVSSLNFLLSSFPFSPLKVPSTSGHFNVLWSNMNVVKPHFLKLLLPYQKVNHFPRWATESRDSHQHKGALSAQLSLTLCVETSFYSLFVCLSVCLFVCLFVCLLVCLFVCLFFVCLFVCLLMQVLWAHPKGSAMSQRAENATV